MTGPKRQVLRIVKQLKDADLNKIASTMGVSINYVKDLCEVLIQDDLLCRGPGGGYSITAKGSRMQIPGGQNRIQPPNYVERQSSGAISERPGERYSIGEMIGEIKMKPNIPSPEQVEVSLRVNPQSSYEEIEKQLTSYTLVCPAKGKEISWHYCSSCAHRDDIDFQKWIVQCKYEFTERRLNMVYGGKALMKLAGTNGEITDLDVESVDLPQVKCPLRNRVIGIDYCVDCRYQRAGEWNHEIPQKGVVGFVICGCPPHLEREYDDGRKMTCRGQEMWIVPQRWE